MISAKTTCSRESPLEPGPSPCQMPHARPVGLDPDHWYAVEYDAALKRGKVLRTGYWGREIALFRGEDGAVRAIEDRCAHRHVRLSLGEVSGCTLTCPYHGWSYAGDGRLQAIPHDLFGHTLPKVKLEAYPVRIRYGLIWIFPGNAAMADSVPMPRIPELEPDAPWASTFHDFTWNAHYSTIVASMRGLSVPERHRCIRPLSSAAIPSAHTDADDIHVDYPHHWFDTGRKSKSGCFLLPLDDKTTRVFIVLCIPALRFPMTQRPLPLCWTRVLLAMFRSVLLKPIMSKQQAHHETADAETAPLQAAHSGR
jgi:nitrite reductase/ring-hydroxylating ferredoxin subunit